MIALLMTLGAAQAQTALPDAAIWLQDKTLAQWSDTRRVGGVQGTLDVTLNPMGVSYAATTWELESSSAAPWVGAEVEAAWLLVLGGETLGAFNPAAGTVCLHALAVARDVGVLLQPGPQGLGDGSGGNNLVGAGLCFASLDDLLESNEQLTVVLAGTGNESWQRSTTLDALQDTWRGSAADPGRPLRKHLNELKAGLSPDELTRVHAVHLGPFRGQGEDAPARWGRLRAADEVVTALARARGDVGHTLRQRRWEEAYLNERLLAPGSAFQLRLDRVGAQPTVPVDAVVAAAPLPPRRDAAPLPIPVREAPTPPPAPPPPVLVPARVDGDPWGTDLDADPWGG